MHSAHPDTGFKSHYSRHIGSEHLNYQRPRAALSAYIAAMRVFAEITAGLPSVPLPHVLFLH